MKNEYTMKRWTLPAVVMALLLCLIGGNALAAAAKYLFWPKGTTPVVMLARFGPYPFESVSWPIAPGADHYRLTVERKNDNTLVSDQDPVIPHSVSDSTVTAYLALAKGTYLITVTAYAGPNEAVAYSQSIQTRITVPASSGGGV
jgi:hypothetical protein